MISSTDFDTCQWAALRSYFATRGHDHHQIRGWEHFLKTILHEIIEENKCVDLTTNGQRHQVHITQVRVAPPTVHESNGEERRVTPNEARLRGLSLTNAVTCTLTHVRSFEDGETGVTQTITKRFHETLLLQIPAMVGIDYDDGSHDTDSYCRDQEALMSPGGYFIVSGNERVLTPQLKLRVNRVFLFPGKYQGKYKWIAEIRSLHSTKYRSTSTLRVCANADTIVVILPFLKKNTSSSLLEVGLRGMFILLGVATEDEATHLVCPPGWPEPCKELVLRALQSDFMKAMSREDIRTWLGKNGTDMNTREKRDKYLHHILQSETLPHMGMDMEAGTLRLKAFFLAKMVRDITEVQCGLRAPSNRDNNSNRKLDGPGPLMSMLFRQLFRLFIKKFRSALIKAFDSENTSVDVTDYVNANRLTGSLRYHFATGNFSLSKGLNMYVQGLNRTSQIATLSQLGRVNTPINKDGAKSTAARELHTSDYGLYCSAETPEGAGVGVTKNLALLAHVCNTTIDQELLELSLTEWLDLDPFHGDAHHGGRLVYVNGSPVGICKDVRATRDECVRMRRARDGIPFDTTLVVLDEDLWVYTSVGRVLRAVFVVDGLASMPGILAAHQEQPSEVWDALAHAGCIEYLDSLEEQHHAKVAETPKDIVPGVHTHVEVHGLSVYSFTTALQVFSNHNQAPRVTFQSAQIKQAINAPLVEFDRNRRMDLHGFFLDNCQQPMVGTRVETLRDQHMLPAGVSVILAVLCCGGWNQEDAFVLKKSYVERGGGTASFFHTFTIDCSPGQVFERPGDDVMHRRGNANYTTVEADGLPAVGDTLREHDVVIGRTETNISLSADGKQTKVKKDNSIVIGTGQAGIVDSVCLTSTKEGLPLAKVKIRQRRCPVVGNKICSRHGQKGTLGKIISEEDLPFSATGMVPDVIMNPLALPSRMTIGELIEGVLAKIGAITGQRGDGTAFRDIRADDIADTLQSLGFHRSGKEQLYDGVTGRPLSAMVFIAPVYHEVLKHFVEDKAYTRTTGKVTVKHRSPPDGRKRRGGLRFGEMERDVSLAQGGSAVLLDRLFEQCDAFQIPVCEECGYIAIAANSNKYGQSTKKDRCRLCTANTQVQHVPIPYATKQLIQMLETCSLGVRMHPSKSPEAL